MEIHLYHCIYDILRSDIPEAENLPTLQKYKAKIVRLHATRPEKAMLDNDSKDRLEGEEPSLFHIINMAKRRETREMRHIQDQHGNIVTRQQDILINFLTHLRQKYQLMEVDNACITKLQEVIPCTCSTKYSYQLEQPITTEEILSALQKGSKHKAPGIDGISLEFHTANWKTIHHDMLELLNQMSLHKRLHPGRNIAS
jgi:hypothetical protein